MTTIVCATDLSGRDDRAIDRMLALAAELGLRPCIVHVVKDAEAVSEADVRLALPDPKADVDILLPAGSPPETIARTASERRAAALVTGVARFNGIGDYFLGTAVDYIVRHASMPVLVVKRRPHAPYGKILFATDFSACAHDALARTAELFPNAAIVVFHAWHPPFEGFLSGEGTRDYAQDKAETGMAAFIAEAGIAVSRRKDVTTQLEHGPVLDAIARAIAAHRPDLVAVGTHGAGGFVQATIGSTALSLLRCVAPDTLIVPPASGT